LILAAFAQVRGSSVSRATFAVNDGELERTTTEAANCNHNCNQASTVTLGLDLVGAGASKTGFDTCRDLPVAQDLVVFDDKGVQIGSTHTDGTSAQASDVQPPDADGAGKETCTDHIVFPDLPTSSQYRVHASGGGNTYDTYINAAQVSDHMVFMEVSSTVPQHRRPVTCVAVTRRPWTTRTTLPQH
jgi:hypothetical protein